MTRQQTMALLACLTRLNAPRMLNKSRICGGQLIGIDAKIEMI